MGFNKVEQIRVISNDHMDALFWLGRYTERVYTTIRLYFSSYDTMIDLSMDDYHKFCASIEIPDIYGSADCFRKNYPFDPENVDSIISNLNRAYDNAIILREQIGSETLSYVQLAIYDIQKAKVSRAPLVELQEVLDHILAFWGIADDNIDSEQVRNIIKAGKRVERIDLYARLRIEPTELTREVHRLAPRIAKCGIRYNRQKLEELQTLAGQEPMDYRRIVNLVETLVD